MDIILSIIIPAYNAEMYIEDCLQSIMTQQGASFEVILVNDGSTDGTTEICRKWAGQYNNIVYIEQENQGQGTARNVAIEHAPGKWLVFLDADDTMLPGALRYLQENVTEDVDIFVYGCIFISQDQKWSWVQIPPCTENKNKIMKEMVSVLWDKAFRTEFWNRENIQMANVYGEDVCPVYLLEAKARKIRTSQIPLMCHFDRIDNLSSVPGQVIQIVHTLSDTIEVFNRKGLFEDYKEPLFFMLLNHHKHYYRLWRLDPLPERKMITEQLEHLAVQYFPGEYRKLLEAEKEALVIIGRIDRPFPAELEARDIYYYSCMEHYLLEGNKVRDVNCHFIINVENEIKSVIKQTRTLEWGLAYWRIQCMEVLEIKKSRGLRGSIFLFSPETHRNEITESFEKTAQEILGCKRLEILEEFWKYADIENSREIARQDGVDRSFDYRGEYLRMDYNMNLLYTWLWIKQRGGCLETYFIEHGYHNIGIYGKGYLGKLLIDELQGTTVNIQFLVDRRCNRDAGYPVYDPEDVLPSVDVIVVSVLHWYDSIRMHMRCASKVISLEEVVDWCKNNSIAEEKGDYGA